MSARVLQQKKCIPETPFMPKTTAWLICLEVEWKQALPYYQGSRWSLNWQGKKTKTFNVHQTPFPPNLTSHSGDTARSPSPLWGYSMHNVRPALNQLSIFGVHLPLALVVFGLCHLVRQTRKRGLATRCNLGEPCLSLADNLFVCCARFAIIPHSIPVPLSLLSNGEGGLLGWLGSAWWSWVSCEVLAGHCIDQSHRKI